MDLLQNLYLARSNTGICLDGLLSRHLVEHATVSWEKVLCKLSEALQDEETLSHLSLLPAMLACRILITLEKNESTEGALRLNGKGKTLLTAILPCSYTSSRVWPASSILFYVIFDWMKRTWIEDHAMKSLRCENEESAKKAGYNILEVQLKKHDMIEVDLDLFCRHKSTVRSTFDLSSGVFHVAPKVCTSCPTSKVKTPTSFPIKGEQKLYQIMHLFQIFVTYVNNLSHGDTPREMIVATVLYIVKARAPSNPKELPMEDLDTTYQPIADSVEKHKSCPIKPPTGTHEGRRVRRKKRSGNADIENASRGANDKKLCGEFEDLPAQTQACQAA